MPGKEQQAPDALSRVEEDTEDRDTPNIKYLISAIMMSPTEEERKDSTELEEAATGPIIQGVFFYWYPP